MQLKKTPKRYPLEHSPLFRLRGKGKFESVLGVRWNVVPMLLDSTNFRVFLNENGREIQAPINMLFQVHKRIGQLLTRIVLPDYIYSQKGHSYVDNARAHLGYTPLVKTDITRFYPSVTRQAVFRLFLDDFECAVDIAHCLADICCYKQEHLPTGSSLSGLVAFFAKKHMFDEINQVAINCNCKMTVYVDDVTISGIGAAKKLLGKIHRIIRKHGLYTSAKKSKTYASSATKMVTGVAINGNDVRLPNVRHLKIHNAKKAVQAADPANLPRAKRVLAGRLQEASQVLNSARNN